MTMKETALEDKSINELQAIAEETTRILKEKQAAIRDSAVQQIEEIAKSAGIRVFIKGTSKKSSTATKLYRHPDQHELTWSGTGAKPKWLRELIKAGSSLADFEVRPEESA